MKLPTLRTRSSGVLLHLTSLPGPHGNGDLGLEGRGFADFLARAGQSWWQMLPVGPAGYGDSPYSSSSAFAGNPLLIDLDGLGIEVERNNALSTSANAVDYDAAGRFRERHLRRAFAQLAHDRGLRGRFEAFCEREASWLEDFALFDALKRANQGRAWIEWDADVRFRRPAGLARARAELAADIEFAKAAQWCFDEQWTSFRAYCHARGIALLGDMPIFMAYDSADVWQHRELFDLDERGAPRNVAGVPPDYFSATGQRWGNPLYRWRVIAKTGYRWWVERFKSALRRFDAVRLDHFIGFVRYWRIPVHEPTATHGKWMKGPGRALFDAVAREIGGTLPLVAEDLGAVTKAVKQLRRELRLPGISLVQFAFGTDPQASTFLPYNLSKNTVVYTGTHDNDTSVGWFTDPGGTSASTRTREQAEQERHNVLTYIGRDHGEAVDVSLELMRIAMSSVARTCILPMQDVLGLGTEARMNRPGVPQGNWRWRLAGDALDARTTERMYRLTTTYGRQPRGGEDVT